MSDTDYSKITPEEAARKVMEIYWDVLDDSGLDEQAKADLMEYISHRALYPVELALEKRLAKLEKDARPCAESVKRNFDSIEMPDEFKKLNKVYQAAQRILGEES